MNNTTILVFSRFCNFDEGKSLLFLYLVKDVMSCLEDKRFHLYGLSDLSRVCKWGASFRRVCHDTVLFLH